jgi:hypothetical protein
MRALAFALLLAACKSKTAPPPAPAAPATTAAPAAPATPAVPAAPALPSSPAKLEPITVADATALLPKLDGDAMIPVKTTADGMQAHATWCLAGTGADAVAASLATTMTAAGYTDLATRGDAQKAGVSGERDGVHLSYVISASSAASCRAPGHYFASATLFRAR